MKSIAVENNIHFKNRYELPKPVLGDEITLQNYSVTPCPQCGGRLWLQSATAFMDEGIGHAIWADCVNSPGCDFSVEFEKIPGIDFRVKKLRNN